MLKTVTRTANILFLTMLACACNSNIDVPQNIIPSVQKPLFISIFSCIIIVPIISFMLTILSGWKNLAFKISLQRYLHVALILMLALAWVVELNFTDSLSSTMNSKVIIYSLLFQVLLVVGAYISLKKQQSRDRKQRFFL